MAELATVVGAGNTGWEWAIKSSKVMGPVKASCQANDSDGVCSTGVVELGVLGANSMEISLMSYSSHPAQKSSRGELESRGVAYSSKSDSTLSV